MEKRNHNKKGIRKYLSDESKHLLFSSKDWAMIPLQLEDIEVQHQHQPDGFNKLINKTKPHDKYRAMDGSSSNSTASSTGNPKYYAKENKRLATERSYLLNRLQRLCTTQRSRENTIISHFETLIKKGMLREQHLKAELSAAQAREQLLNDRAADREMFLEDLKSTYEIKNNNLEMEINRLKLIIKEQKEREEKEYGQMLTDERTKFAKLESEQRLLRKEITKSDVKCKALQRDLSRMHQELALTKDEMQKLQLENDHLKQSSNTSSSIYHKMASEDDGERTEERKDTISNNKAIVEEGNAKVTLPIATVTSRTADARPLPPPYTTTLSPASLPVDQMRTDNDSQFPSGNTSNVTERMLTSPTPNVNPSSNVTGSREISSSGDSTLLLDRLDRLSRLAQRLLEEAN